MSRGFGLSIPLLIVVLATARADPVIGPMTSCSVVTKAFNNSEGDKIRGIDEEIRTVFNDLDEMHTKNGEPGIISGMSDSGLETTVAMAAANCEKIPKRTLYNAAAITYRAIRSLEMSLGAAK